MDWPHRAHSGFIDAGGWRWHVQRRGTGAGLLLVHGTGGSTHSWSGALDALATTHAVIVVDLPGHGFTTPLPGGVADDVYSLTGLARALSSLVHTLGAKIDVAAGHSAGVPLLMQATLDGGITPQQLVGFNPALVPPPEWYIALFAPVLGRLVERNAVADAGAWLARATRLVDAMLSTTGSTLTAPQLAHYRQLCERPAHVHAALSMMSRWDLPRLLRDAVGLRVPMTLVGGTRDRWIPPQSIARVVERLPMAHFETVDAGHLIPDERPDVVVATINSSRPPVPGDSPTRDRA